MTDRSINRILGSIVLLAGLGTAAPAMAQMAGPGGMAGGLGPIGGTSNLHARSEPQEMAPRALPGASSAGNVSAGPVTDTTGDPTTLLFKAINHGDYAQARAAVGRGANLNAQNALGETPIELSVELNRDRITFMLLSARAEEAPAQASTQPASAAPAHAGPAPKVVADKGARHVGASRQAPVRRAAAQSAYPAADDPGRPNPAAGFLGFGS